MTQNNSEQLLNYLIQRANSEKNWFGFLEQRIAGVDLAYKIAANHADKLSPSEIVNFVKELNDKIYENILNPQNK